MFDPNEEPQENGFELEKKDRDDTEMDMTPMVDVTFLLLIFFMVTAAFSLQKSLEIPAPKDDRPSTQSKEEEDEDPSLITVLVDEYNTYHVSTSEEEKEVPSKAELYRQLKQLAKNMSKHVTARMLVKAHEECLHEFVVTAIDAGAAAGMQEVQLMTVEEGDE